MAAITTTKQLETIDQNLARVIIQYPGFIDFTLRRLIDDNIVKTIHNKMRGDGISEKIIASTFLSVETDRKARTIRYFVISNYNADTATGGKFPVAIFIEEGRRAYLVEAPEPTDDRPNPHLGPIEGDGGTFWLKKAKIPRYTARKYVEETIQEQKAFVQGLFNDAQNQWLADNGIPIN